MNPEKLRVAREKLTRVFRYLEALNQHRNPARRQIREQLWSLWLHDLPDHPSSIAAWLEVGWDDPSREPSFSPSRNESDQEGQARIANFADEPARLAALLRWKVAREEWAKSEKPARAAMKIFETLYALYGRIDREAERVELVLGDGILSWSHAEGSIYHPILLQRLQLQFNAAVPEFTLSEADHPVELYSALFQSMT